VSKEELYKRHLGYSDINPEDEGNTHHNCKFLIKLQINMLPLPREHQEQLFFPQMPSEQEIIHELCAIKEYYANYREQITITYCQPYH